MKSVKKISVLVNQIKTIPTTGLSKLKGGKESGGICIIGIVTD